MVRKWPPQHRLMGGRHGPGGFPIGLIGGSSVADTDPDLDLLFSAPLLSWVSATDPSSDNTQDLNADINAADDIETYVVRVVGMRNTSTFTAPYDLDETNTVDAGEAAAFLLSFPGLALSPDGTWYVTGWIETAGGTRVSPIAATISKVIATYTPTFYWLGF